MFFSWFKNSTPSLVPHQAVSLPLMKEQDCFEMSVALEPCDAGLECVCFLLKEDGLCETSYVIDKNHAEGVDGQVDWFGCKGELQQGFRLNLSSLPDGIHSILMVAYLPDAGCLDEWGVGSFTAKMGRHSWGWTFHGARLGSGCLLELASLNRQTKSGWKLSIRGIGRNEDIDAFARYLFPKIEAEVLVPAVERVMRDKKELLVLGEEPHDIKRIQLLAPNLLKEYQIAHTEVAKLQAGWAIPSQVVLVLDYTQKMMPMYQDGQMQTFINQMIALASVWNEVGRIDCFLIGQSAGYVGTIDWTNYEQCVEEWMKNHEFGTKLIYGKAFEAVRRKVYPRNRGGKTDKLCVKEDKPVCVVSLMSQAVEDASMAQWQLRWSSYEPLFWEFLAITGGKGSLKIDEVLARQGGVGGDFRFLDQLNNLEERAVHNTGYLTMGSMKEYVLRDLYIAIVKNYNEWLSRAVKKGMVKSV